MKIYTVKGFWPAPPKHSLANHERTPAIHERTPAMHERTNAMHERSLPANDGVDKDLQNYRILVEIFKGYLDTALKVHTTYYAFTGVLAAYYLAHGTEISYLKLSLLIPFFLGLALAFVSFNGMKQALTMQGKVNDVVRGLAMKEAPPVVILRRSLCVIGFLDLIFCGGLLFLFFWSRLIFRL